MNRIFTEFDKEFKALCDKHSMEKVAYVQVVLVGPERGVKIFTGGEMSACRLVDLALTDYMDSLGRKIPKAPAH